MNVGVVKLALIACFMVLGKCACCSPIPLRCLIVGSDGGAVPVSAETVSNKVDEVNRIFRQAAMSFTVESCVVTNAVGLFEIDETNVVQRSLLYSMLPNGDGLKMIYVNRISGDTEAFWSHYGIIITASARAEVVAHEIGHACGLTDIYDHCDGVYFSGADYRVDEVKLPYDWGSYDWLLAHDDLVKRLLMYGYHLDEKADIPAGGVFGLKKIGRRVYKDLTNVGRDGMLLFPPRSN